MRAPPESLRPMTGAPTFIAWSMILQIFSACASDKRAAEHGEILAEDEDQPAVDRAVAGDHAVARDLLLVHAEIAAAVLDEHVPFLEGAGIEQQLEALARGQLALGVLRPDAPLPPPARAAARFSSSFLRMSLIGRILPGQSQSVTPAKAGARGRPHFACSGFPLARE